MKKQNTASICISNMPKISAIYYALLQSGYDFYAMGRDEEHNAGIRGYCGKENMSSFFAGVKQGGCEVYPYWPRAAVLETASFYLTEDGTRFHNWDAFRSRVMHAENIADHERDVRLWDWIGAFPSELSRVMSTDDFGQYLEWEEAWIAAQNSMYAEELRGIARCLDMCVSQYASPVRDMQIIINPIKCIYSADFHMDGHCFVFCSGMLRIESVVHEFLHHVVHPAVMDMADIIAANPGPYPGIDASYYLSGDHAGRRNAFEEYAVRMLTLDVMLNRYPDDLASFLLGLV